MNQDVERLQIALAIEKSMSDFWFDTMKEQTAQYRAQAEKAHAVLTSVAMKWIVAGSDFDESWRTQLSTLVKDYWEEFGKNQSKPFRDSEDDFGQQCDYWPTNRE